MLPGCILTLFFLIFSMWAFSRAKKVTKINNSAIIVPGLLSNITVVSPHSTRGRMYQATLQYTALNNQKIIYVISRKFEAVDFLQANLNKSEVNVNVHYSRDNPQYFYIKELTLPKWRYYLLSGFLALLGLACFVVFLLIL